MVLRRKRAVRCLAFALAACVVGGGLLTAAILRPIDAERYLKVNGSSQLVDRAGAPLYVFLNDAEQWCFPVPLDKINPNLVKATIAAEDQRFYSHAGVDVLAVIRAAWQNVTNVEVTSGASTLTMQVVKQQARRTRSLAGKVSQAIDAIRLERHAGKSEILAAYLNLAPYGLNLVGCEAASRRYFGKSSRELTLAESALLAGLPKAPTALMPLAHPERAVARRNHVLRRMAEEGYITQVALDRALKAPLGVKRHAFPSLAPHLAMRMRGAIPSGGTLKTTLDARVQQDAERIVAHSIRNVRKDIGNAAVIVVDVAEGSIVARVGSADFFDTPGGGQVDACRAPRSPGSALKPFTYALGMELGCLYASETLLDYTLDYGRFNPVNFDETYRGLVSASDALKQSLNIPAVTVAERVGIDKLLALLRKSGVSTLTKPADHYGLGLTLGNCEVRLEDLAAAYVMLARLGEYRPLRVVAKTPPAPGVRLLSAGTCARLFDMLEQPLPNEMGGGVVQAAGVRPPLCWKTGTSSGHRDAWAFVFNRHYLVGVWMGNNNGRGSKRLFGAWSALPLAGKLFRSLEPKTGPAWPDTTVTMRTASVCALTGLPPSEFCPQTRQETFPVNQFLNRTCDVHYPAPGDIGNLGRTRVVTRWPGSAKGWDLARVAARAADNPNGAVLERASNLRILAPSNEAEYVLTGEAQGDRIKVSTSMDAVTPVHWYMNDRFLGTSEPSKPLYLDLAAGRHKLTCMTDTGATDSVTFRVVTPDAQSHTRFQGA